MKRYLYLFLALAGIILAGCSEETDTTTENDGYARLNVSFGAPQTYSGGQEVLPEEKVLKSVAFFIETESGEFHRYLSDQNDFETVKTDTDGNITAVGLKIGGTNPNGTARIAAIGNHAENGLAGALAAVNSMQDLVAMQSRDIEDYPIASPFLACQEPTDLVIAGGTTQHKTFELKRLAARIDLTITYWDNGVEKDPATLLYLPEVKVFSPKTRSYLLPASEQAVSEIEQATIVEPSLTVSATNMTLTYYTYESSELDAAPLYIKMIYRNTGWQELNLVLTDGDDKPVIRRNHYYSPNINL